MKKWIILLIVIFIFGLTVLADNQGRQDCKHSWNYTPCMVRSIDPNTMTITRVCEHCQRIEKTKLSEWECVDEELPTPDDIYTRSATITTSVNALEQQCQHNNLEAVGYKCWGYAHNFDGGYWSVDGQGGMGLNRAYKCKDCGVIVHINSATFTKE